MLGAWPKFLSLVWFRLTLSRSAPHLSATVNFRHRPHLPPPPPPPPPPPQLLPPLPARPTSPRRRWHSVLFDSPDAGLPRAHTPSIAFWHLQGRCRKAMLGMWRGQRRPKGSGTNHTPSTAFRHLPPNSARDFTRKTLQTQNYYVPQDCSRKYPDLLERTFTPTCFLN